MAVSDIELDGAMLLDVEVLRAELKKRGLALVETSQDDNYTYYEVVYVH